VLTQRDPTRVIDLRVPANRDTLVADWRQLVVDVPEASYFQTPDWALSWMNNFGADRPARIACWYDGDRLLGLVALHRHSERLHSRLPVVLSAWSLLGSGYSSADHLGVVATDSVFPDVVAWLRRTFSSQTLLMSGLPESQLHRYSALGEGAVIAETQCPRIALQPSPPIPPKFAKKLAYYLRRLNKEGVEFSWMGPGEIDAVLLESLADLHEDRWEMKSGDRPPHLRNRLQFFADLVRLGDDDRGPRCIVAKVDRKIVGVLLGFVSNGTFAYFQTGWDPAFAPLSLGTVLVERAISESAQRGLSTFDFLRGTEQYKYRFGAEDAVDRTLLFPHGAHGYLMKWKYTKGRSVARRLERQ
jgi:CelD/BcsL family acetyltransferase involved in cellulose biosynthesis